MCLHHHCQAGLHSFSLPQYNVPVPGNDKAHTEKSLSSDPAPASTSVAADPYQPGPVTEANTSGLESKLNSSTTATEPVTFPPATATNPAARQTPLGPTFVYVVPQQPQDQQQILYATSPPTNFSNSIGGGGYVLTVPTTIQDSHQPQQVIYYPATSSPSPLPPAQSPQQTVVVPLPPGQVELPSQRMDDPPELQELPLRTQETAWTGQQYRR